MALELHIFGPIANLPSVDPDCLAAIVYLAKAVPRNEWRLVASSNQASNPYRQLPALRDNAHDNLWVAGYTSIVSYLKERSNGVWDLDAGLSSSQVADSHAYTAFILSRGLPLLDLNLYVSSDNYNNVTRPAWSDLLSWPESWTLPHNMREVARKRSEHLGLSALDVDAAKEKEEKKENEGVIGHIPKSLRKPKQSVRAILGQTTQNTKLRLDAVTSDFLDVLKDALLVGERLNSSDGESGILGEGFHTVDCLLVAYLTFMQRLGMPQSWLKDALQDRYKTLGNWAKIHADQLLGNGSFTGEAAQSVRSGSKLPPLEVPSTSVAENIQTAIEELVSSIPLIRSGFNKRQVDYMTERKKHTDRDRQVAYTNLRNKQVFYSQAVTTVLTTTSLLAWLVHAGVLSWPQRRSSAMPQRRNFGEAGVLLGLS